ncbi:MAG TPA: leucyl/phenylalanyl-tRNA--protein transferase, partial [Hydrogenophaga sp.]
LRKTIKHLHLDGRLDVRFDHNFSDVIRECARTRRRDQNGTWIVPDMVAAYTDLHRAGHAHSVETWVDGQLVGGLYTVMIGKMVFGESMFSHRSDASKIALAGLVAFALEHDLPMIDCQQNTAHMATLGSETMDRNEFCQQVARHVEGPSPAWQFNPVYWKHLFSLDGY